MQFPQCECLDDPSASLIHSQKCYDEWPYTIPEDPMRDTHIYKA